MHNTRTYDFGTSHFVNDTSHFFNDTPLALLKRSVNNKMRSAKISTHKQIRLDADFSVLFLYVNFMYKVERLHAKVKARKSISYKLHQNKEKIVFVIASKRYLHESRMIKQNACSSLEEKYTLIKTKVMYLHLDLHKELNFSIQYIFQTTTLLANTLKYLASIPKVVYCKV